MEGWGWGGLEEEEGWSTSPAVRTFGGGPRKPFLNPAKPSSFLALGFGSVIVGTGLGAQS